MIRKGRSIWKKKQILNTIRLNSCNWIKNELRISNIYPEHTEIVKWPESSKQPVHRDLSRKTTVFTSVLYLNDNFQGGETYFPDIGEVVKPRTGRIVGFPGTLVLHGVQKILTGTRYTVPCWFTNMIDSAEP